MTNPCKICAIRFLFRPVPIAVGRWALYAHWYCYSVVRCGVPSLRQGHKSKMKADSTDFTRIGLSQIHFLIIFRQWYLDFVLDLAEFASAVALPLLAVCSPLCSLVRLEPLWKSAFGIHYPMGTFLVGFMPKWGNVLAHVGQRACPCWARCLPKNVLFSA